jgi:hypothetical protein
VSGHPFAEQLHDARTRLLAALGGSSQFVLAWLTVDAVMRGIYLAMTVIVPVIVAVAAVFARAYAEEWAKVKLAVARDREIARLKAELSTRPAWAPPIETDSYI